MLKETALPISQVDLWDSGGACVQTSETTSVFLGSVCGIVQEQRGDIVTENIKENQCDTVPMPPGIEMVVCHYEDSFEVERTIVETLEKFLQRSNVQEQINYFRDRTGRRHELSDEEIVHRGDVFSFDVVVVRSNYDKESHAKFESEIIEAMKNEDLSEGDDGFLAVRRYQGRFFYDGPGCSCDNIQEVTSRTTVPCKWDNLGHGYIVYPI